MIGASQRMLDHFAIDRNIALILDDGISKLCGMAASCPARRAEPTSPILE
jgi:hypothetical protein